MERCVSKGYVFQMEMIVRARQLNYTVGEVRPMIHVFHCLVFHCTVCPALCISLHTVLANCEQALLEKNPK